MTTEIRQQFIKADSPWIVEIIEDLGQKAIFGCQRIDCNFGRYSEGQLYRVTNGSQGGYELSPDFAVSFVKERIKLYEYGNADKVHRYDHCLLHEKDN